eukprot:gene6338-8726_t
MKFDSGNPFDEDNTTGNPFDGEVKNSNKSCFSVSTGNPFNDDEDCGILSPLASNGKSRSNRQSYSPLVSSNELGNQEEVIKKPRIPSKINMEGNSGKSTGSVNAKNQANNDKDKFSASMKRMNTALNSFTESGVVAVDPNKTNEVVRFFLSGRVYGYPGTDGTVTSNYIAYTRNEHPLLGLLFIDWNHPFVRKDRIIVYCNALAFAVFVSFVLTETELVGPIASCVNGCDITDFKNNTITNSTTICHGGYNNGISYHKYNSRCKYFHPWMISAVCGALTVFYQSLMRFFATCGCVKGRDLFTTNCIGNKIRKLTEFFGGQVLAVFTVLSLSLLLWTIAEIYITDSQYVILVPILLAKIWAFGEWFLWTAPYFAYRYPIDKSYFHRSRRKSQAQETSSV